MKTLSKIQQKVVNKMKEVGYMRVLDVFQTCSKLITIYKVGCLSVRESTFNALIRKKIIEFSEMKRITKIYKLIK